MIKEEALTRSIEDLKAEIDSLSRTVLDFRYEDFKRVVLTQIQFTISEYYNRFLSLRMERMDCMPPCRTRKRCKGKLRDLFDDMTSDFLRDDFDSPIIKLEGMEGDIEEGSTSCGSEECKTDTLEMIRDIKMLIILAEQIRERIEGAGNDHPMEHLREKETIAPDEISHLIYPLSHPARISILRELDRREMAFTDISRHLGMRTGHLQFHLKPLLQERYVYKIRNRGDYSITPRGRLALDFLEILFQRMS